MPLLSKVQVFLLPSSLEIAAKAIRCKNCVPTKGDVSNFVNASTSDSVKTSFPEMNWRSRAADPDISRVVSFKFDSSQVREFDGEEIFDRYKRKDFRKDRCS
jgi:hypothetical protein